MSDSIEKRQSAAVLLVHGLTGDSWGIQEALIESDVSMTAGWPLFWEAGNLLRTYLPDDMREHLLERLRQEIVSQRLSDEDAGQ
ncbi:hypothetical protein ACXYX3_11330 [Mycobacterium sp. C3-094]